MLPFLTTFLLAAAPAETVYAVADPAAQVLAAPPGLQPTGGRLPYGVAVVAVEEAKADGKEYVKVRLRDEPRTALGWAARAGLGSPKEFDPTMRAAAPIPTDGLSGIDLVMASIHNARGKYLDDRAKALGASAAALAAVLKVESGGRGFGADGRVVVRFENHVFARRWGRSHPTEFARHFRYDPKEGWKGQQWRRAEGDPWTACHADQAGEWAVLDFARTLDADAALASASYGVGQIMGFNHKAVGHGSAREMVDKFGEGIGPQLDAMIAFIRNNGKCLRGLRAGDYTLFAEGYNGTGKAAAYAARIKEAADAYARVTAGR